MSFFIEDILNTKNYGKDEKITSNVEKRVVNSTDIKTEVIENRLENKNEDVRAERCSFNPSFSDQNSILHQTLVNRLNSPYYRSSESHQGSPLEPYQHFCYDTAYLNYYRAFYDRDFSTLQRQKSWPSYDVPQTNYLPYAMQYKYIYSPSKRKGGQVRFTSHQTDVLEKRFCSNKYLSPEERKVLAESLSLSDRQVKTWFQNRRAKWRRTHSNGEQLPENFSEEELTAKK